MDFKKSPFRGGSPPPSHDAQVGVYTISGKSVTKKKNARFRYFQEPLYAPDSFFLTLLWSLSNMQKTRSQSDSSSSRSIHLKLATIWDFDPNSDFLCKSTIFLYKFYKGKWLIYKGNPLWAPQNRNSEKVGELISKLRQYFDFGFFTIEIWVGSYRKKC